jgi:hypothetical protein
MATVAPEAAPEADRPEGAASSTDYKELMEEAKSEASESSPDKATEAAASEPASTEASSQDSGGKSGRGGRSSRRGKAERTSEARTAVEAATAPQDSTESAPTTESQAETKESTSAAQTLQAEWEAAQGRSVDISRMIKANTPEKAAKERARLIGQEQEVAAKFENPEGAASAIAERLQAAGLGGVAEQMKSSLLQNAGQEAATILQRHEAERSALNEKDARHEQNLAQALAVTATGVHSEKGSDTPINFQNQEDAKEYYTELKGVLGLQLLDVRTSKNGDELYYRSTVPGWENSLLAIIQDPKTGEIQKMVILGHENAIEEKRPSVASRLLSFIRRQAPIVKEVPSRHIDNLMNRYRADGGGSVAADEGDYEPGQPRKRRPRY